MSRSDIILKVETKNIDIWRNPSTGIKTTIFCSYFLRFKKAQKGNI